MIDINKLTENISKNIAIKCKINKTLCNIIFYNPKKNSDEEIRDESYKIRLRKYIVLY